MWETFGDLASIIIADIVLSGDNALVIGMAAAALSPELRKKAIIYGMMLAAGLRIVFAIIATKLLAIPGLLFVGALLLFWVCWRLYLEIRQHQDEAALHALERADDENRGYTGAPRQGLRRALTSILIADVSMSIDNVLAVAAIAHGDVNMLVFGLMLAIFLMAFAATLIMKILARYPLVSWAGLIILGYVALKMLYRGLFDAAHGVVPLLQVWLS